MATADTEHDAPILQKQPTLVLDTVEPASSSVTPTQESDDYKKPQTGGLKLSLRLFAGAAVVVLVTNVGWFIWAWQRYGVIAGSKAHLGFGSVYEGDCDRASMISTWLHLLINTLSTLLLLASNNFMQAITSPTREEVQRAHQKRKWVHIGVLSLRNLSHISLRKTFLCLLLLVSSIPFHLLYNSLIFTANSTSLYNWAVVTPDFLTGATFNASYYDLGYYNNAHYVDHEYIRLAKSLQDAVHTYKRLENADCINTYANTLSSGRRNVVLVAEARSAKTRYGDTVHDDPAIYNFTGSLLSFGYPSINLGLDTWNDWLCPGYSGGQALCVPSSYFPNGKGFQIAGFPISYCLSEQITQICSVRFSWAIMIAVIACNVVKVVAMGYMVWRFEAEEFLATVGDAMASFLLSPDSTTTTLYPTTYRRIRKTWHRNRHTPTVPAMRSSRQYYTAISTSRWLLFTLLVCVAVGAVLVLLIWGLSTLRTFTISPWSLGFGTANVPNLAFEGGPGPSLIELAVLGNLPQLALSILFTVFMSLVTTLFVARDWNNFGRAPQTLMTSNPAGRQRGTWLLSMPALPGGVIFAFQVLFHWFVSQALFAVSIDVLLADGNMSNMEVNDLSYSPDAICASLAAAVVLLSIPFVFGMCKMKEVEPYTVATCSAAIAAACQIHGNPKGDRLVYEALIWGENAEYSVPGRSGFVPTETQVKQEKVKKRTVVQRIGYAISGAGLFVTGLLFG